MSYFQPNAATATVCRDAMDRALWESVACLLTNSSVPMFIPDTPPTATGADYAAYADIVLPRPDGVEVDTGVLAGSADYLTRRLSGDRATEPSRLKIASLADYSPDRAQSLVRWWDTDPANRLWMSAVSSDHYAQARELIELALARIGEAAPDLFEETRALISEIVVVRPDADTRIIYDGGSSFGTWGAFVLNADAHQGWVRYYKTVVHEAGHNLLFGLARDEPLVVNDPGDTFVSPVRDDARPMDGVFHAAFVMAREALAFDRLLNWHDATGGLSDAEKKEVDTLLLDSVVAFWQCIETLRGHGRLTAIGAKVLDACEDYMKANFALMTE